MSGSLSEALEKRGRFGNEPRAQCWLAATEEHRTLHGREDKIGDLAAFESFGQFAGLDGRLQTVVKRVADFVEDFN
jgi:hypothetical protein